MGSQVNISAKKQAAIDAALAETERKRKELERRMDPDSAAVEAGAAALRELREIAVLDEEPERAAQAVIDALVAGEHCVPTEEHQRIVDMHAEAFRIAYDNQERLTHVEADLAEARAEINRLIAEAHAQEQRWNASHEYARISEYRRRTHAAEAGLVSAKTIIQDARSYVAAHEPDPQHLTVSMDAFLGDSPHD